MNGKSTNLTNKPDEETVGNKRISQLKDNEAETEENIKFNKNTEKLTSEEKHTDKTSKDDLLNILKKIDDLNKLDNLDDSDEEKMFNEDEEDSEFDVLDEKKNVVTDGAGIL